jgi:hypothetical protein
MLDPHHTDWFKIEFSAHDVCQIRAFLRHGVSGIVREFRCDYNTPAAKRRHR